MCYRADSGVVLRAQREEPDLRSPGVRSGETLEGGGDRHVGLADCESIGGGESNRHGNPAILPLAECIGVAAGRQAAKAPNGCKFLTYGAPTRMNAICPEPLGGAVGHRPTVRSRRGHFWLRWREQ